MHTNKINLQIKIEEEEVSLFILKYFFIQKSKYEIKTDKIFFCLLEILTNLEVINTFKK